MTEMDGPGWEGVEEIVKSLQNLHKFKDCAVLTEHENMCETPDQHTVDFLENVIKSHCSSETFSEQLKNGSLSCKDYWIDQVEKVGDNFFIYMMLDDSDLLGLNQRLNPDLEQEYEPPMILKIENKGNVASLKEMATYVVASRLSKEDDADQLGIPAIPTGLKSNVKKFVRMAQAGKNDMLYHDSIKAVFHPNFWTKPCSKVYQLIGMKDETLSLLNESGEIRNDLKLGDIDEDCEDDVGEEIKNAIETDTDILCWVRTAHWVGATCKEETIFQTNVNDEFSQNFYKFPKRGRGATPYIYTRGATKSARLHCKHAGIGGPCKRRELHS